MIHITKYNEFLISIYGKNGTLYRQKLGILVDISCISRFSIVKNPCGIVQNTHVQYCIVRRDNPAWGVYALAVFLGDLECPVAARARVTDVTFTHLNDVHHPLVDLTQRRDFYSVHTHTYIHYIQYESKKSPISFSDIFSEQLGILVQISRACYTFLSTLDYKFLFNYLQGDAIV